MHSPAPVHIVGKEAKML